MALFIGIVLLCVVSLSHQVCWEDVGNDLDPKLLGYVANDNQYDSFLISGHSLIDPLSMLLMGAEGETRTQLAKALELQPGQKVTPKESVCKSQVGYDKASKLFLGKQYKPDVFYEQEIEKVIGSEIGNVDFKNITAAANTINKWIRSKTNNLVNHVVYPFDISPKTVAVIANAFTLASRWLLPFNPKNTEEKNFYRPEQVQFMRIKEYFYVRDVKSMDAKAVYLPMENYELGMVLVLPNKVDGLQRVLESLSRNELLNGSVTLELSSLSVPKFEIETSLELNNFLKSEKLDNRRQTGSAGGKKCKFDEADDKILDIIGKNTPVLEGLDVPEASGTQDTIQPSNIETTLHNTPKNTKSIIRLKKEKLEAEMLLTNEKIELAKREKYKLELEIYKLEKELNIRVSTFTEQFHEQDTIEIISLVSPPIQTKTV